MPSTFMPSLPDGAANFIPSSLSDQLDALSKLDGPDLAGQLLALFQGPGLDQRRRPFRVRVGAAGAGGSSLDDALLIKSVDIGEAMCADVCVHMKLLCLTTRADLPSRAFIGQPVSVEFVTDMGGLRTVNGIITSAVPGPSDGGVRVWMVEAFDALTVMDQGSNERVFTSGSVIDIVRAVFTMWRQGSPVLGQAFDFDLGDLRPEDHPVREFCMQATESDAAYVRRLLRKHGIGWVVHPGRPAKGSAAPADERDMGHTVHLFAESMSLPRNDTGTVAYKLDGAAQERDAITDWSEVHRLVPGKLVRQSWDYKAYGVNSISLDTQADLGDQGLALAANIVDHQIDPAHWGNSQGDYERLSAARMKRHEMRACMVHGASGVRTLACGTWFDVTGRPDGKALAASDREFVIVKARHFGDNNFDKAINARLESLFARAGWHVERPVIGVHGDARRYGNTFEAVQRNTPIVPAFDARTDWPQIQSRTAVVVGPKNEEVHLDELGRPQISFPGVSVIDLGRGQPQGGMLQTGEQPDLRPTLRTSAPVRLASPYASSGHGQITPPRIGDEVVVTFMNGSPDHPLISASVYSPQNPTPTFGHKGGLPGNRHLAGIRAKEVGSDRASDLLLDSTPAQTGVRLSSDHAHARISAGFITNEREDGRADPLGEGIYACTDEAAATRAARGILQSAWARLNASGKQLDITETYALMQAGHELLKTMGEYATQHQALAVDHEPHAELNATAKNWQAGTNTDPKAHKQATAIIAQSSPQGIASNTAKSIVHYAGENIDTVAQQHLQQVAGQRYTLNAGQGISQFAHAGGIRHIAHQGDYIAQSQHGSTMIDSAQHITSRAVGEYTVMAKTFTAIAEDGSFIKIGGGGITLGSNGPIKSFGSAFPHSGPQTMSGTKPEFSKGQVQGKFVLRYNFMSTSSPVMPNTPYEIDMTDGSTLKGISDAHGHTSLSLRDAMHIAAVRISRM